MIATVPIHRHPPPLQNDRLKQPPRSIDRNLGAVIHRRLHRPRAARQVQTQPGGMGIGGAHCNAQNLRLFGDRGQRGIGPNGQNLIIAGLHPALRRDRALKRHDRQTHLDRAAKESCARHPQSARLLQPSDKRWIAPNGAHRVIADLGFGSALGHHAPPANMSG